jgi:hypothetical protein
VRTVSDPSGAAREVLRKYGMLWARRNDRRQAAPLEVRLEVRFTGHFRSSTLAAYIGALWALVPPFGVRALVTRRYKRTGTQHVPCVRLLYGSAQARRLFDAIGWQTGNPRLDERLRAWRSWLDYRAAAGSWQEPTAP